MTLNSEELEWLDELVAESQTDRASVLRMLLNKQKTNPTDQEKEESSTSLRPSEKINKTPIIPKVRIVEPSKFDEMPICIHFLSEGIVINLNLTMMEPDQAQRAVDFVAGGTYALKGHQQRIGESIFLFTPAGIDVKNIGEEEIKHAIVTECTDALDGNSPAKTPLLKEANQKQDLSDTSKKESTENQIDSQETEDHENKK